MILPMYFLVKLLLICNTLEYLNIHTQSNWQVFGKGRLGIKTVAPDRPCNKSCHVWLIVYALMICKAVVCVGLNFVRQSKASELQEPAGGVGTKTAGIALVNLTVMHFFPVDLGMPYLVAPWL